MMPPSIDSVVWLESLGALGLPDDAVVIVDQGLPRAILDAFPGALEVQAGESLKRLEAIGALAERVLQVRSTRPLTLVAVGGGSLGDAVGFLASVLWRGVGLWHVPTTLLAMVDSAHGGKTAMNLSLAKNQLGTFYPASRVCVVREILDHLPPAQIEEGMAELVKSLWIADAQGVDAWAQGPGTRALVTGHRDALVGLLKRAVQVKYDVVAQDPTETRGIRTWLNLGHTVAHALELALGLSHGRAVAWGLAACAFISHDAFGLERAQRDLLLAQVAPLLGAMVQLSERLPFEAFERLVRRDKKRVGSTLRSVIVREKGRVEVTTEVTPRQWYDALHEALRWWGARPLQVAHLERARGRVELAASKSELNRALVIQALRPGPTTLLGPDSEAQDVVALRHALAALEGTREHVTVDAGLGGTTFRFLIGVALTRPGATTITAHPKLLARPHGALYDAARTAGARVSVEETGVRVEPARTFQQGVRVRCEASSQYASALALMSASGRPVDLMLVTDDAGGYERAQVASVAYLEMTLALLRQAGVEVTWEGGLVRCRPTQALNEAVALTVTADESSAAVWRCANALGARVMLPASTPKSLQPDRGLVQMLERLRATPNSQECALDLHGAPDLAPVLVATATRMECGLRITNAAHLRLKESNRIDDLVAAMSEVGVDVRATPDGLHVPQGVQVPREGARWPTFHDHRFAMAGALLGQGIVVEHPQVVAKSYPAFWRHATWLGARVDDVE